MSFDEVWQRRRSIEIKRGIAALLPSLDHLILTKRLGSRPKDAVDIRLLQALRSGGVPMIEPTTMIRPSREALDRAKSLAERSLSVAGFDA